MSGPEQPEHSGHSGQPGHSGEPEDVGSVGEEAAKLFGALTDWAHDWARDSAVGAGSEQAAGLGGLAAGAASVAGSLSEHVAARIDTGAEECAYCPVCRTVHVLRQASPEVRAHLTQAASSFLQAAAGLLAALPERGTPASGGASAAPGAARSDFERIDLDDDEPEGGR